MLIILCQLHRHAEACKITHFMELWAGKALTWATAVWERACKPIASYEQFMGLMTHPRRGNWRGAFDLNSGSTPHSRKVFEFQTITARSEQNEPVLKDVFCNRLNLEMLTELAWCDDKLAHQPVYSS